MENPTMDNKELKAQLIKMRNSIQDYLDNMNMDEAEKKEPKPNGKAKDKEEEDG
jgi:hypothetical protein